MFKIKSLPFCSAIVALLVASSGSVFALDNTQILLTTGDAAPDGNGVFSDFHEFRGPGLGNSGQATFLAELTGTDDTDSRSSGIFMNDGVTGPQRVVREDQVLPTGDRILRFFSNDVVTTNNLGELAFDSRIVFSNGSVGLGLFIADGQGSFASVSRTFDAVPDGNGQFSQFFGIRLNDSGKTVFSSTINQTAGGDNDDRGIYTGDGSTAPVLVAREGQLAPNGNGEFVINFAASGINNAGQVLFQTDLRNTAGDASDDNAIYVSDATTGLVQIARKGQAGPQGDGTFSRIGNPEINNAGQVVFEANFTGSTNGSSGVFVYDGTAELRKIVRIGDAVPGSNGGFTNGFRGQTINDTGEVARIASIVDNDNNVGSFGSGIFRDAGSGLQHVQIFGDPIPTGNGVFLGFNSLALNEVGQLVFGASLGDTTGGDADDSGLFFYDSNFGLSEIAREGDLLLGRQITNILFDEEESENALNDAGQVVYQFELADGRKGIALWSAAVVLGDVSQDGTVTFADIAPFIEVLQAGTFLEEADVNQDGAVTFADIAPFIVILSAT